MSDPTDLTNAHIVELKELVDDKTKPALERLCEAACLFISDLCALELAERAEQAKQKKGKGK